MNSIFHLVLVSFSIHYCRAVFENITVDSRRRICSDGTIACPGTLKCVQESYICDNDDDCGNGWDEILCAHGRACRLNSCEHECILNSRNEPLCKCRNGYALGVNKKSCDDVNECDSVPPRCNQVCENLEAAFKCSCFSGYLKQPGFDNCTDIDECVNVDICDHKCLNTDGSYKCECNEGYSIGEDGKSCKPDEGLLTKLLYSVNGNIYGYSMLFNQEYVLIENAHPAITSISYDIEHSMIYWLETHFNEGALLKSDLKSNNRNIIRRFKCPTEMDVDYLNLKIYVVEQCPPSILACEMNGEKCVTVVSEQIKQPVSIKVDPTNKIMYWTDWNYNYGIQSASLDGNDGNTLVNVGIKKPVKITVDPIKQIIYWTDLESKSIESYNTITKQIHEVYNGLQPNSLAVFGDAIYFTHNELRQIRKCNSKSCNEKVEIIQSLAQSHTKMISAIEISHPLLVPEGPNACDNNRCSYMCLLSQNDNFTCVCPTGYTLDDTSYICIKTVQDEVNLNCESPNFLCDSGLCISRDDLCNGIDDCGDLQDEYQDNCKNNISTNLNGNETETSDSELLTTLPSLLLTEFDTFNNNDSFTSDYTRFITESLELDNEQSTTPITESVVDIPVLVSSTPIPEGEGGNEAESEATNEVLEQFFFQGKKHPEDMYLIGQIMRKIEARQDYFEKKIIEVLSKAGLKINFE